MKMMRRITWIGICILSMVSLSLSGQQNFASISFGTSIPLNAYPQTGDLSSGGYAKTGATIKFDGAYFPGSYLGIGGSFTFGSNYAQQDSVVKDMITYIQDNASSITEIPDYAEIIYGSGFWNYINLFIGPHFSMRATQKLYFDLRVLAGLTVLRTPDQDLRITYDETDIQTFASNNNLAFGWSAGAGARIDLNSNLALKLSADYFQTKAVFVYEFGLFDPVAEGVPPLEAEFYVQTVELTIGLAYAF